MDIIEWRKKNRGTRAYAHFDGRVSLDQVWEYVDNPQKVASHGFYPFISYDKVSNKYSKKTGIKEKTRKLCYSAHLDRCIYQYYGYKLNLLYNNKAISDKLNEVAIAYRDNLHQNNIHFSKRAIDKIRDMCDCYIFVGDFTNFFDQIDHKYLKQKLQELVENHKLPQDLYNVYKNITSYSTWDLGTILSINGLPENGNGIKLLNCMDKALPYAKFKLLKKRYVQKNANNFGIPQGSAISAVLSNIYMLDFDNIIQKYILEQEGLYMRYSDDFIIVIPNRGVEYFKSNMQYFDNEVKNIPGLNLQPDKTQCYLYTSGNLANCNNLINNLNGKVCKTLDYLGFSFDGKVVSIRGKTVTKYYYRMYRKLKTIVNSKGYTKNGNKIPLKKLYLKYTVKGSKIGTGNFISYVQRAERIFGKNEAINRSTKRHMQKIRRELNKIPLSAP